MRGSNFFIPYATPHPAAHKTTTPSGAPHARGSAAAATPRRGEAHREHFHRSERPECDRTDAREHRAREYGRVHAVHVHRERRDRTQRAGHGDPRPETSKE